MKIVIDGRMYGLENAGIGRYVNNLIEQIGNLDKENEYFILLRKKYFNLLKFKSTKFKKILADYPHYSLLEQILLPLQLAKLKPELVHFPHFNVPTFYFGKYVVTIHDLIKHTSKGMATTTRNPWFYWLKYLGYKIVFRQAVKRAKKILVPSGVVKQELIETYSVSQNKVVVTYEGVDEKFQSSVISHQSSVEILSKYKISKPFLIYTGSVYPHKNIERLIQSIKLLNQSPITSHQSPVSLIISCSRTVFWERLRDKARNLKAEKFVKLLGFVPDEELAGLYNQASAFVFPSLSEGFGLPGLEAMSVGLPVICSNIAVFHEIYGEAAIYFDPDDPADIARKIELVLKDEELREKLKKLGLELVEKYSWQRMARETISVYEERR